MKVTSYEIQDENHVDIFDLDPLKRWILRTTRAFTKFFKVISRGKAFEDHVRYSSDPVANVLYEILNDTVAQYQDLHAVDALKNGGLFTIYFSSVDSVYRPGRDYLLSKLLEPENVKRLQAALEKEDQDFKYRTPEKWYPNLHIKALETTKDRRRRGLIRTTHGVSAQEASFMDHEVHAQYKHQLNQQAHQMEEH